MPGGMDPSAHGLNITLEPEHAARLARLARLTGVPESTLARMMLSRAIEEADPDAGSIVAILEGIPGVYEHVMDSLEQGRQGGGIGLDDL